MKPLFAILPYIRTEKPFPIGNILFRSSHDTEGLTPEEADHLKNIVSLFYLTDEQPVDEAVYALLHLSDDRDRVDSQVKQLRAAHTVLTFLVTRDHLYDSYEQLTLYAVIPTQIYATTELSASLVAGYSVTINWIHWCEVAQGKKMYPPQPYPLAIIPKGWNLSDLEYDLGSDTLLAGFNEFIKGRLLNRPEQIDRFETLLRAMSWYNRSFSQFDSEEEKIIHLAVAFEALFHQKDSPDIRKELTMHLQGLFGEAPRLDAWVNQFYSERSNIVHEGFATKLRFTIGNKRPVEQQLVMDSLASYGRRLLRLCIFNVLHATLLAEEANLNAWFTHDEERLQEICKQLRDETVAAEQRLLSTVDLVYDLGEVWVHYLHQESIELKTVHAAGKKLAQVYLAAYPDTEPAIRQQLEQIMSMELDNPLDVVDVYRKLSVELHKELATYRGKYWPRKPYQALAHFAKYAGSSSFRAKAYHLSTEQKQKQ